MFQLNASVAISSDSRSSLWTLPIFLLPFHLIMIEAALFGNCSLTACNRTSSKSTVIFLRRTLRFLPWQANLSMMKHCCLNLGLLLHLLYNVSNSCLGSFWWVIMSMIFCYDWSFSSVVALPKHGQSTHLQYIWPSRPLYWYPPDSMNSLSCGELSHYWWNFVYWACPYQIGLYWHVLSESMFTEHPHTVESGYQVHITY